MSGVTASLADETVAQSSNAVDVAAAATEALAVAALRVGFGLMTIAAASDTVFALIDGGGFLAGIEGVVLTALAVSGLLRPATAARLLHPPGRVVIAAALFALAGAFDWGIQSHFSEVAPAIVWIAVIVSSPPWIVACVLVSAAGYLVDLLLKGHSLAWTLTSTGRELVVNQWVDLAANAGAVLVLVVLLRRFTVGVPSSLAAARADAPAITLPLAAAVRAEPVLLLPRADAASLIAPLTDAEHNLLAMLRDGLGTTEYRRELVGTGRRTGSMLADASVFTSPRALGSMSHPA